MVSAMPLPPDTNPKTAFLIVLWTFHAIGWIFLVLRFTVRILRRTLGADDWCMFAGWAFQLGGGVLTTIEANLGDMRHIEYIPLSNLKKIAVLGQANLPLGIVAVFLCKTSVALLLLRILDRTSKKRRKFLWVTVVVYLLISIAAIIILFAQCNPARAAWDKELVAEGKATCLSPSVSQDIGIAQSAWGAYMDFALALLPITIIWNLEMSLSRRIATCGLLSLGIIAGVFGVLKLTQFHVLSPPDPTGNSFHFYLWTTLEISCVVIAGCIPPCKPFWKWIVNGEPIRDGPGTTFSQPRELGLIRLANWSGISFVNNPFRAFRTTKPGSESNVTATSLELHRRDERPSHERYSDV